MLQVKIPEWELYDEENNLFYSGKEQTLTLEHSLVSISKWESKYCKPFISDKGKTQEESLYYIQCMTLTPNVDPHLYQCIPDDIFNLIIKYIDSPMSATTFSNREGQSGRREVVTSELIYYWMIALGIPFECQKWHINRLLTLIRICEIKNSPKKKMSRNEVLSRNRELNAARKQAAHSKG